MKKNVKRVLLSLSILLGLIVFIFLGYILKAKSETKTMASVASQEIIENVFSIQDSFSNLYLVKDSSQYIAIDAGNNIDVVSAELIKLGINPDKVVAIFLTHSDGDHVAAIKLFKNAKVYLSVNEEQMINGVTSRFLFFGNKIDVKDYSLMANQQIETIGNIIVKGISTPGHTSGSMCYLINDKYLFTGDLLSLKEGKIERFNEFFNMDTETSLKSLENIMHLPNCEYILTAHYGYTSEYKNATGDWSY